MFELNASQDAFDENFPVRSDVIKLAQKFYPMDSQLHRFLEDMCKLVGWNEKQLFTEIFKENL